jgi:hypothetical protein
MGSKMFELIRLHWPILLFVGSSIASVAVTTYISRETKIKWEKQAVLNQKISSHLDKTSGKEYRTKLDCEKEMERCPVRMQLANDQRYGEAQRESLIAMLNNLTNEASRHHTEVMDEFQRHRALHEAIDARHAELSKQVAVLESKIG